ncbi:hypothetical protein AKJ09_03518 [Labilithrix luteola]|uniref:PHA accumulation regulator DNA-binding N-terminal domain-containing protein n=1 Tax=Labilithrix luteola TaxID=1391654 RepID=A0A0K1PUP4_9BACT|nr:polyhydroxyalkanoate synthesis regulator DNA-binding domain-containing protein [Labilithrix luteola]AKU96854.1 hypothetical protein AKJ09_03518 [Labilithrix luteola]
MDSKPQPDSAAAAGTSGGAGGAGTGSGSDRPRRIIKRYSNRKLYDTKDSRYVTLLQIAEMVRTGEEVQIIDNNTKEDLTEVTLAQIIYEEQKQKASTSRNVPLQTLKELIHQRTEKVLSDLREGPIGRLIPGAKGEPGKPGEGGTPTPPQVQENGTAPSSATMQAAAPVVPPGTVTTPTTGGAKPSLVDQAKETLEDWQHKIDERVKAVVPNLLPWQQLQLEIKRLNARIEELEEKVKTLQKR